MCERGIDRDIDTREREKRIACLSVLGLEKEKSVLAYVFLKERETVCMCLR